MEKIKGSLERDLVNSDFEQNNDDFLKKSNFESFIGADSKIVLTPQDIFKGDNKSVGGKAVHLATMMAKGLNVPAFVVLTYEPKTIDEWTQLFSWWDQNDACVLAVRSSALGEDSSGYSFAGQLSSYLNIATKDELMKAVKKCFASINREASLAYQEHFQQETQQMSVVVQKMVNPEFSGVYFSNDPRGILEGWVIEVIEGFGEDLVSGRKTPYLFTDEEIPDHLPLTWKESNIEKILDLGKQIKEIFHYDVDVEWALDYAGNLHALQARPVTTGHSERNDLYQIERELKRIKEKFHGEDVVWDGQTFAEFVGFPSYLTFSIWKQAFAPQGAFGRALRQVGYAGFEKVSFNPKDTLLERVFGRAYINLNLLNKLYFGKTPFSIKMEPRQHLVFDWKKLDWETLLRSPRAIGQMFKVMFRLQGGRKQMFEECEKALNRYQLVLKPHRSLHYAEWNDVYLFDSLRKQAETFSNEYLMWPFVLIMMIESTLQILLSQLEKVVGTDEATKLLNRWMAKGLETVTSEMNQDFQQACHFKEKRWNFLEKYGHRGPGEMDLANPRWLELGDKAFFKPLFNSSQNQFRESTTTVEDEIMKTVTNFRRNIILEEWRMLKKMLELREAGKMVIMKTYANIRWLALEIGRRKGLNEDIFWLRLSEVLKLEENSQVRDKILDRKPRFHAFRKLSFPVVVALSQIENILEGNNENTKNNTYEGEGLSPGLSFGQVRVVEDPNQIDFSEWPSDAILVTEATDPGWTALFQRVKGIVVERGGVLSHCAILAREMGLPAVSRILGCTRKLKDGDRVWIDGTNGRITLA